MFNETAPSQLCFQHYDSIVDLPLAYYLVYIPAGLFGLFGNGFFIYLYYIQKMIVLERVTFRRLIFFLTLIDLVICLHILIDCGLHSTLVEKQLVILEFWQSIRNILLASEAILLLFIAIDRLVAIRYPTSMHWTVNVIHWQLGGGVLLIAAFDMSCRLSMLEFMPCQHRQQALVVYKLTYAGLALLFILAGFGIYWVVFVSYVNYMNSSNRWRSRSHPPPVAAATAGPHVNHVRRHLLDSPPPCGGSSYIAQAEDHSRHSSVQYDVGLITKVRSCLRMAKILCLITVVFTLTTLPMFCLNIIFAEITSSLIVLFNSFYLKAVINPVIYLVSSSSHRSQLLHLLKRMC